MNTQTAAALRALSDKLKRAKVNSGGLVEMPHDFGMYDLEAVRAAVLSDLDKEIRTEGTQEGAEPQWCTQLAEALDWAPCECVTDTREGVRSTNVCRRCKVLRDYKAASTAAPAEPRAAEGAGTIAALRKENEDLRLEFDMCNSFLAESREEVKTAIYCLRTTIGADCDDYSVEDYCAAALAEVKRLRTHAAPAPRGGVTEADQKELVTRIWDAIRVWDGRGKDAGPMARHWREAISLQHGTAWLNAIEQEARALAAKEAK
jgi:hypothetical protein